MDDVAAQGMRQCITKLQHKPHGVGNRQRAIALDQVLEVDSLDEFKNNVVPAMVLTDVGALPDVFVVESRGRLPSFLKRRSVSSSSD